MKNRIRFAITLAVSVLCVLPNVATAQSGPFESEFVGLAAPIEGTWIVTIGNAQGVTLFTALQSFTAGGVTVATGTGDRLPPFGMPTAPISPLSGTWHRMDDHTYVLTICFFIFDPAGNAHYMFKTNETLQLKDGNLVGNGVGFYCDTNGNNCGVLPGLIGPQPPITITGKRLVAQGA